MPPRRERDERRRNPFEVEDVSAMVDDLIADAPSPPQSDESERKTPRTPHEESRAARFVGVTFPSSAWRAAISEMADAWGIRNSDFVTFFQSGRFDNHLFLSKMIMRPSSVRNSSTWSIDSETSQMIGARPPVAMTVNSCPTSFLIRFTRPSTRPAYP